MEWNSGENGETIFIFTFVLLDGENGKSENENKGRISEKQATPWLIRSFQNHLSLRACPKRSKSVMPSPP
jgi:hypothetical protein